MLAWVKASGEDEMHAGLRDGRQVSISVQGLKDTQHPSVCITEEKDGAVLRSEDTRTGCKDGM